MTKNWRIQHRPIKTLHHSHGTSDTAGRGLKSVIPYHSPTTLGGSFLRSNRERISVGFWVVFFFSCTDTSKQREKLVEELNIKMIHVKLTTEIFLDSKQETQLDESLTPLKLNLSRTRPSCNFPCMAPKQPQSHSDLVICSEEIRLMRPGGQGLLWAGCGFHTWPWPGCRSLCKLKHSQNKFVFHLSSLLRDFSLPPVSAW